MKTRNVTVINIIFLLHEVEQLRKSQLAQINHRFGDCNYQVKFKTFMWDSGQDAIGLAWRTLQWPSQKSIYQNSYENKTTKVYWRFMVYIFPSSNTFHFISSWKRSTFSWGFENQIRESFKVLSFNSLKTKYCVVRVSSISKKI